LTGQRGSQPFWNVLCEKYWLLRILIVAQNEMIWAFQL
jgi:hypothetical protein